MSALERQHNRSVEGDVGGIARTSRPIWTIKLVDTLDNGLEDVITRPDDRLLTDPRHWTTAPGREVVLLLRGHIAGPASGPQEDPSCRRHGPELDRKCRRILDRAALDEVGAPVALRPIVRPPQRLGNGGHLLLAAQQASDCRHNALIVGFAFLLDPFAHRVFAPPQLSRNRG